MHIPATTGIGSPTVSAVTEFARRLAARMAPPTSAAAPEPATQEAATTLTPAMLRAALLDLGAAADAENLALAEAFAHLGLPLTREALAEANATLAHAPGASPLAYALARAWSLPTSPAGLRALTAVTGDGMAAPPGALPPGWMSWLGLAAEAGMEPETLAAHLFLMAQGMGRSTEQRIVAHMRSGGEAPQILPDTRTTLLRLAQGSADRDIRRGAEALATHIEGQQLINQAARRSTADQVPFYLAVPVQFDGETSLTEMRLWSWDDDQEPKDQEAGTPWLRATVRLATARLGRVQAEIVGTLAGTLTCRLGAEKPATARLLHRHAGTLSAALAALGVWRTSQVECRVQSEWPPLWHGGEAMAAPRTRVDWRA